MYNILCYVCYIYIYVCRDEAKLFYIVFIYILIIFVQVQIQNPVHFGKKDTQLGPFDALGERNALYIRINIH